MDVATATILYGICSFFLGYAIGWLFRILEYMGRDFIS